MTLLAPIKSLAEYPEHTYIPHDEIHNGMFHERGIHDPMEILRLWDERRENLTAFQMRKFRRCPKCSHPSRCWPLLHRDAVRCRWGHETTGLEMARCR